MTLCAEVIMGYYLEPQLSMLFYSGPPDVFVLETLILKREKSSSLNKVASMLADNF